MDYNLTPAFPQLVVMLTHNDFTVENAEEVFEQCKDSAARFWGMKEKPLAPERMQALFARMRECGKTTALEVVGYDERQGMEGARLAHRCGCDILMGTRFHESIAVYCRDAGMRYMPFVGDIEGRPSVLAGTIDDIIAEARDVISRGAWGIDLLGYRYTGDASELIRRLVAAVAAPVCIAGSIDSFRRLDEVRQAGAHSFTIGSAFFDGCFPGTMPERIDAVCRHMTS